MDIKPIKTEVDYESALEEIDRLFDSEPGTPDGDKLEVLVTLVEAYEAKHHKIPLPDPIEAIEHYMASHGLTRQDLIPYLGSAPRVSEILNRKRHLTLRMIRNLELLGIPASILVQKYDLDIAEDGIEADIDVDDLFVRCDWEPKLAKVRETVTLFMQSLNAGYAMVGIISVPIAFRSRHRHTPTENANAGNICSDIDILQSNQALLGLFGCAGALSNYSTSDLPPERIQ